MRDKYLLKILEHQVVANISGLYEHDCVELMAVLKIGGAPVIALSIIFAAPGL
jgi:hypothetical protein